MGPPGALADELAEAQRLGFLGPGPVDTHLAHAEGLAACAGEPPAGALVVDLGSGGGVPGLPLAVAWPASRWLLVESQARRARFLRAAVVRLGLAGRVVVGEGRAEGLARDPAWRGRAALVVARSFGPPAVTAECGSPFLEVGGRLVVSEPPSARSRAGRWSETGVAPLGLALMGPCHHGAHFVVLAQATSCPDAYPRRAPAKRPLF